MTHNPAWLAVVKMELTLTPPQMKKLAFNLGKLEKTNLKHKSIVLDVDTNACRDWITEKMWDKILVHGKIHFL